MRYFLFTFKYTFWDLGRRHEGDGIVHFTADEFPSIEDVRELAVGVLDENYRKHHPEDGSMKFAPVPKVTPMLWQEFRSEADFINYTGSYNNVGSVRQT